MAWRGGVRLAKWREALDAEPGPVYVRYLLGLSLTSHPGLVCGGVRVIFGGIVMGESSEGGAAPRLSASQQALVQGNLGLIGVHLRRHVPNLAVVRRDREYDDLFQEGCLGLMRAAARWDPACGIPFAAFAFPRIHNAISLALKCKFSTVYVPPRFGSKRENANDGNAANTDVARPREYSLSEAQWLNLTETPAGEPVVSCGETIGDRVRDKYERAVRSGVETLKGRASVRGDREELLEIAVRERMLVPNEEMRRSLRQIARETKSSYARVAQCSTQLADEVKAALSGDPEFGELLRRARNHADGFAAPMDACTERALTEVGARAYGRRFEHADEEDRARLVYALMRRMDFDMGGFVRDGFGKLERAQREQLLRNPIDRDESRAASTRAGASSMKRRRKAVTAVAPSR